jgi:hypothetical protein
MLRKNRTNIYIPRSERAAELLSDPVHACVCVRLPVVPRAWAMLAVVSPLTGGVVDPGRPRLTLEQIFFYFSLDSAINSGLTPYRVAPLTLKLPSRI